MARRPPRRKPRRRVLGRLRRRWWLAAALITSAAAAFVLVSFLEEIPLPDALPGAQSSRVLAADGSLVATLHGEENRTSVPLDAISDDLERAVVATEDRNFFSHSGLSIRGIVRATWANLRGRRVAQGGSTITQQYVRNAFAQVGRERTLTRKLREAVLAVKMEREVSKTEILSAYLNTVYFGRGAYGAEAAARTYFKRRASELTLSESAYLAGVIRAPERFQPDRDRRAAIGIRNAVLEDLVEAGRVSEEKASVLTRAPLRFNLSATTEQESATGGYFVEFVKRELYERFELTDAEIFAGGLTIRTTLDLSMQRAAEQAVATTLDRDDDPEGALAALDVEGRVRAMVGGRDVGSIKRARGTNFAAPRKAGRQAGSAFKPFTLAAFVDDGFSVSSKFTAPGKLEVEAPECRDPAGRNWILENFAEVDWGVLDVMTATAQSVNTVYAQMIDLVGPERVAAIAAAAGITSSLQPVCSLALGTQSVTPLEMARAFATFAARGRRADPLAVTKIVAGGGRLIAEHRPSLHRVIAPLVADTVNLTLQRVLTSGTGHRRQIGRPAAAKTGTSQDHLDAWFVGYTPQISAAVWVGFPPDGSGRVRPMIGVRGHNVIGETLPGEIWEKFMIAATQGIEPRGFAEPAVGGTIVTPSPTPCPSPAPEGAFCLEPSPKPKTKPKPKPSPTPTPAASPVSPSPSPAPTPTTSDGPPSG